MAFGRDPHRGERFVVLVGELNAAIGSEPAFAEQCAE
jgi:hypothetical protein